LILSEDYNVGKVSSGLSKRRFAEKQKHTENFRQYLGEMWNSDDIQFLAIGKKGHTFFDSFQRSYWRDQINLSFFGYNYWNGRRENKLARPITGLHIAIRPEKAAGLRDFLVNKPANETFILPYPRGDYHLSFAKRSLFGPTELKWIFLNHKEEWDKALLLPRSEKNRTRKELKLDETRQQLWFAADQSDKLIPYLDAVIPTYTFLR
jgi:hypothetical protein